MSTTDDISTKVSKELFTRGVYLMDVNRGGFQHIDVAWGEFVPFTSPVGRVLFEQYLTWVIARDLGATFTRCA